MTDGFHCDETNGNFSKYASTFRQFCVVRPSCQCHTEAVPKALVQTQLPILLYYDVHFPELAIGFLFFPICPTQSARPHSTLRIQQSNLTLSGFTQLFSSTIGIGPSLYNIAITKLFANIADISLDSSIS